MSSTDAFMTVTATLRRATELFGEREAVVDGTIRWTFRELDDEAHRIAGALQTCGAEPGERVALWAPNSSRWIAASFGVYLAGGILVPVNTRFKGDEAAHVLRRSGASTLFASTDVLGINLLAHLEGFDLPQLKKRVVFDGPPHPDADNWIDFTSRSANQRISDPALVGPADTSDIIFTSGTTGAPKGAMLTHGASVKTYLQWSEAVGLQEGDRYLCVYPFFHTAGLKSAILACVLRGAAIVPHAVFDPPSVMQMVEDERITVLPGPPTVFQSILEHPGRKAYDLSSLRLSVTGAASVPVEVVRRMRDDLGIDTVVTGYGLTETTGTVSMCHHDDPPDIIAHTVGRPLAGVSVRVVDEHSAPLAPGEQGEIMVRGSNVMRGYFDDAAATTAAFDKAGWLHTGDIGFLGEDGNLRITDRKKDMIIVGGFNAFPAEIEGTMLRHPGVAQVAVVGVPDARLGEVGRAFVIRARGADIDEDRLIRWCRDHMANYKVPRTVCFVESLPQTPSGKVQRFKLRDEAAS